MDDLFNQRFCFGYEIFYGETILFEDCGGGGGCAVFVDTEGIALGADPAMPALRDAGFDGDAGCDAWGENLILIGLVLFDEKFPRGKGDEAEVVPVSG